MAREGMALEFWSYPYTTTLPTNGKLALYYALCCEFDNTEIIVEDMSLATGLELSECRNWVEIFMAAGQLEVAV